MSEPIPELQKIDVKFGIGAPADADWDALLSIFSRWRLEEGEEILDLADYSHVPEAPSIILVSKLWQFGVDFSRGSGSSRPEGWAGFFFSNRKGLEGDPADRLRSVLAKALGKIQRLCGEKEFPPDVTVDCGKVEISFNDRLLTPNTDAMDTSLRPALENALATLYGEDGFELVREDDPGRRLGYYARAAEDDLDPAAAISKLS
jgi:hypothetical protein